ncbi:MAG: hypothetical protein GX599_01270 [Chloroflexi bacterium]|nr:hypothetical protein [Chloroflexota bacterium]
MANSRGARLSGSPACLRAQGGLDPYRNRGVWDVGRFRVKSLHMKHLQKSWLLCVALVLSLTACAESGRALPLVSAPDPLGRFEFSIPEGWQSSFAGEVYTFTPANSDNGEESLRVRLYLSPTNTLNANQHLDTAEPLIQAFLSSQLDADYEVINQSEIRVDRYPALQLDIAKPHLDSYMLGKLVMVAMPGMVVLLLGTGIQADWEAFLPTFRAMLKSFHLVSAYTQTPPQS